jgi:hypothetical protein
MTTLVRARHLTPDSHVVIARTFGEIHDSAVPTAHGGPPEVNVLDVVAPNGNGTDRWHSDSPFIPEPTDATFLNAEMQRRLPPMTHPVVRTLPCSAACGDRPATSSSTTTGACSTSRSLTTPTAGSRTSSRARVPARREPPTVHGAPVKTSLRLRRARSSCNGGQGRVIDGRLPLLEAGGSGREARSGGS